MRCREAILEHAHVDGARGEAAVGGEAEREPARVEGLRGTADHAAHLVRGRIRVRVRVRVRVRMRVRMRVRARVRVGAN